MYSYHKYKNDNDNNNNNNNNNNGKIVIIITFSTPPLLWTQFANTEYKLDQHTLWLRIYIYIYIEIKKKHLSVSICSPPVWLMHLESATDRCNCLKRSMRSQKRFQSDCGGRLSGTVRVFVSSRGALKRERSVIVVFGFERWQSEESMFPERVLME